MTSAERLVLILTADLTVAIYTAPLVYQDELAKRLKEARHALYLENFSAANGSGECPTSR